MFPTLRLDEYPRRVVFMAAAAGLALLVDFLSKELAVALEPDALLFHRGSRSLLGLDAAAIWLAAAASLAACVLPARVVAVGAGTALGGALGNLASRPRWWESRGGTPDFIRLGDGSVGNVADLLIAAGAGAMLLGAVGWLAWELGRSFQRGH